MGTPGEREDAFLVAFESLHRRRGKSQVPQLCVEGAGERERMGLNGKNRERSMDIKFAHTSKIKDGVYNCWQKLMSKMFVNAKEHVLLLPMLYKIG